MGDMLVRNVAEATKAALKRKADAAGKPLNDIAREALDAAAKPNKQEIWAEADRIREHIRARVGQRSSRLHPGIRQDRIRR